MNTVILFVLLLALLAEAQIQNVVSDICDFELSILLETDTDLLDNVASGLFTANTNWHQ